MDGGSFAASEDGPWASIPASLRPLLGLDQLDPFLAGGAAGNDGAIRPPGSLAELLARTGSLWPETDALPIPAVPSGAQPLRAALEDYSATMGLGALPADIGLTIAGLALSKDAEGALSQLVLAYSQAVRLQREATKDLTEQDRLLLAAEPSAIEAWFAQDPSRTLDDYDQAMSTLVEQRMDLGKTWQASDLLARTIDVVRPSLASTPVTSSTIPDARSGLQPDTSADLASTRFVASEEWSDLLSLTAAVSGLDSTPVPAVRAVPLAEALQHLGAALGIPSEQLPATNGLLPASLDLAIGSLVEAKAVGMRSDSPATHAQIMVATVAAAEPTLRAWAALLESPLDASKTATPDLTSFLSETLSPTPNPSALLSAGLGLGPADVPSIPPLAPLLVEEGMSTQGASTLALSLPPNVAAALALLLQSAQRLEAAHAATISTLSPEQYAAFVATPSIMATLERPYWTAAQAKTVESWARTSHTIDWDAMRQVQQLQASVAAATQAATVLLQDYSQSVPDPIEPSVPLMFEAPEAVQGTCPGSSFSKCADDVWVDISPKTVPGVTRGIVITGFGSTRIDNRFGGGRPDITIDLGGNDDYHIAAGATNSSLGIPIVHQSSWDSYKGIMGAIVPPYAKPSGEIVANLSRHVNIAIDVSGHDRYFGKFELAQGAGDGPGTVGILWDLEGDDEYDQEGDPEKWQAFGQGLGRMGGVGILVDGAGDDSYRAPKSTGQGTGISPIYVHERMTTLVPGDPHQMRPFGGAGLLLDLGDGADSYEAADGQGHSAGYGTLGLLLDQSGESQYFASDFDPKFQGGRGDTSDYEGLRQDLENLVGNLVELPNERFGGLAALIDLGGQGDNYSNFELPPHYRIIKHKDQLPEKQDDILWADGRNAFAFGLDTTLADEDDDRHPNLVELLAGSDPHDEADTPKEAIQSGDAVDDVQEIIEGLGDPTSDRDDDGYFDFLETAAGSDPNNTESTPRTQLDHVILDDQLLCPLDAQPACAPAGTFPPKVGQVRCDPNNQSYCVSLLTLGGGGSTTYGHPAIVSIDLGGNDTYHTRVGWSGEVAVQGSVLAPGTLAVDVAGSDGYETPLVDGTQGFATGRGATLLADLGGDDVYEAGRFSQGAADGGVAFLIDIDGADSFQAAQTSQGFAQRTGAAGLLDLKGNDRYEFANQGRVASHEAAALLFDGAGRDTYTSTLIPVLHTGLSAENPRNAFASQGAVDVSADETEGVGFTMTDGRLGARPAAGIFIDAGEEPDTYITRAEDGSFQDISYVKNDVGIRANDVDAPAPPSSGTPTSGIATAPLLLRAAFFLDGVSALRDDPDGDRVPTPLELLAGSDPYSKPADDRAVDVQPQKGLVGDVLAANRLALPGLIIGADGSNVYDEYAPFIVDLGGDDDYTAPFIGGMTPTMTGTYRRNPGIFLPATDVSVILDVAGDDAYEPATCVIDETVELTASTNYGKVVEDGLVHRITHCPSLGGALAGISILADAGGSNTFSSTFRTRYVADPPGVSDATLRVTTWGLSQAAGMYGGVGLLTTWDSTNEFRSLVRVEAQELDESQDPLAIAYGLTQGAAWGGIGILASFGSGNDSYESITEAVASNQGADIGVPRDLAQGAAQQGIAILLDEGGQNSFRAPNGFAQGYGSKRTLESNDFLLNAPSQTAPNYMALGLLWSGPGDDQFLGGARSQGSAAEARRPSFAMENILAGQKLQGKTFGVLLDGGGNDQYRLRNPDPTIVSNRLFCPVPAAAATPACALSQGAAMDGGVALLLDLAGDDSYVANGRTHVQGVGIGGAGFLLDLGGNDIYKAYRRSQGYATNTLVDLRKVSTGIDPGQLSNLDLPGRLENALASIGLLIDPRGWDSYTADSEAQGFIHWVPPFETRLILGFLADGSGEDKYNYKGLKVRPEAPTGTPPADRNDWTWQGALLAAASPAPAPPSVSVGFGGGTDSGNLDDAIKSINDRTQKPLGGTLDAWVSRDEAGADVVASGARAGGNLYVQARVRPAEGFAVQRVDFLIQGEVFAMGKPAGTAADGALLFHAPWTTRPPTDTPLASAHPDGTYNVVATAFVAPTRTPTSASFVGPPDGHNIQSPPATFLLDNPPLVGGTLSTRGLSTVLGQKATLALEVSQDGDANPQGVAPGGRLTLTLRNLTSNAVVPLQSQSPISGGTTFIEVDGRCEGAPCPDGKYALLALIKDDSGQENQIERTIVLDNTAPKTSLPADATANETRKQGLNNLIVQWTGSDRLTGLAADAVAGVKDTVLVQLHPTASLADLKDIDVPPLNVFSAGTADSEHLPSVVNGQKVRLLTVAKDDFQNLESPCIAGESPPCYRAKIAQNPSAVRDVLVDFVRPLLDDARASSDHVRPGGPVDYFVNATDQHSGIKEVRILLASGWEDEMSLVAPGSYTYHEDGTHTLGIPANEQFYAYTITAHDTAGNRQPLALTGHMDALPPRVTPEQTRYGDGSLLEGRKDLKVTVRARVADLQPATLVADLTAVAGAPATCSQGSDPTDVALWTCEAFLLDSVPDGEYQIPLRAVDRAGNVNDTARALVRVNGDPTSLLDIGIPKIGHDHFIVAWKTGKPANARIAFGKTPELGRQTDTLPAHGLDHAVNVTGLSPSTNYFFRVISETPAGVRTESDILNVLTGNAFNLQLPNLRDNAWRAQVTVNATVDILTGEGNVSIVAKVQDEAERSSPVQVASFSRGEGDANFTLDTTGFADGGYRLILEGNRLGDFQVVRSSVFRIDNTAPILVPISPLPQAITGTVRPAIKVGVFDPAAPAPALSTLNLTIDGAFITPLNATYASVSGSATQRTLTFDLPASLPDAIHRIEVRLSDAAGNVGLAEWTFRVDVTAPRLQQPADLVYTPGPAAAKPGGSISVRIDLADEAGVASVILDMTAIAGAKAPLLSMGSGRWNATFPIAASAPQGSFELPLVATDGFGNKATVQTVRVIVDSQPPVFAKLDVQPDGFTKARAIAETDEPTKLHLNRAEGAAAAATSPTYATQHTLTLGGLRPGQQYGILVTATDGAGNEVVFSKALRTPTDASAPSAPPNLALTSTNEGVVQLDWDDAIDNSGIDRYLIERIGNGKPTQLASVPGNQTSFVDPAAPAGSTVAYGVTAVDLAGRPGAKSTASIKVRALPHLSEPDISPKNGAAGEPFLFSVLYQHASGDPAASVAVSYAGQEYPLALASPADCSQSCRYEGRHHLPAFSPLETEPTIVFNAIAEGDRTEVPLDWSPLVKADPSQIRLKSGADLDKHKSPGADLIMLLAAVAIVAAVAARRLKP